MASKYPNPVCFNLVSKTFDICTNVAANFKSSYGIVKFPSVHIFIKLMYLVPANCELAARR
jgi:hypothetical protein